MSKILAFDTETYMMGPGLMKPPVVCITVADLERNSFGVATADPDFKKTAEELLAPGVLLLGQNVSYDLAVLGQQWPDLVPRIWEKLIAGEVVDIRIRDMLLNLGTHGKLKYLYLPDGNKEMIKYSMAAMVQRYLGIDLSEEKGMEDAWRKRYNELDGMPFGEFPEEARRYALMDSVYVIDLFLAQEKRHQNMQENRGLDLVQPAAFHTAIDYALKLITAQGMATNADKVREIEAKLDEEYHDLSKFPLLVEAGIIRLPEPARVHVKQMRKAQELIGNADPLDNREILEASGIKFTKPKPASRNTKALQELIVKVSEATKTEVKLTAKKGISTDAEVLMNLAVYDKTIAEYQRRMILDKLVTTEMPSFHWKDEIAPKVYFNYGILKETGRTSSFGGDAYYPSRNGQQVDPRTRPCFEPTEGFWLASSDYNSLELCSTAHVTKLLFGESKHYDKVSAGVDMHAFLGAQLAYNLNDDFRTVCNQLTNWVTPDVCYDLFLSLKSHSDPALRKFFKHWRKFAKPVGLGYPGGLGAKTFVTLAHKQYGVNLVEYASTMPEEFFDPLVVNHTVVYHGKRMGLVENKRVAQWTPKLRAIALAQYLKEIWLDTYPEMRQYFAWIREQTDQFNLRKVRDFDTDEETLRSALCYTSPMGMHRANCTYTQAANGNVMQTPSAEGFKIAFFNVVRACEDPSQRSVLNECKCKVVNEVHDEIITEVPAFVGIANACIAEKERIMKESMEMVLYTVPIGVETALMTRWHKFADPVTNEEGLLVPWEPEEEDA